MAIIIRMLSLVELPKLSALPLRPRACLDLSRVLHRSSKDLLLTLPQLARSTKAIQIPAQLAQIFRHLISSIRPLRFLSTYLLVAFPRGWESPPPTDSSNRRTIP